MKVRCFTSAGWKEYEGKKLVGHGWAYVGDRPHERLNFYLVELEGGWSVTDSIAGLAVGKGATKTAAMAMARDRISEHGMIFMFILASLSLRNQEAELRGDPMPHPEVAYPLHMWKWVREAKAEGRPLPPNHWAASHEEKKDDRVGAVYLIRAGDRYKIGKSIRPKDRFAGMSLPEKPEILLVHHTPQYAKAEREVHKKFASHRRHGEWFEFSKEELPEVEEAIRAF